MYRQMHHHQNSLTLFPDFGQLVALECAFNGSLSIVGRPLSRCDSRYRGTVTVIPPEGGLLAGGFGRYIAPPSPYGIATRSSLGEDSAWPCSRAERFKTRLAEACLMQTVLSGESG